MNNFTSNSPSENNFVHAAIARNIMPNNNTGLTLVMYTPTMRPAGSHVDDNVADPVLAMLASLNAQMKSLTDQIASMATSITRSNDITTHLQETVANIVSGQTVVQNTASRYNVTSDIEAVTGLSSLMEDDYVPGKRYPAISIRFDLRIMVKTSNTFLIEIDQWLEWVLISYFTDGYNHGLALALTAYLQIQPQSAGILTRELACMKKNCIKKTLAWFVNFCNVHQHPPEHAKFCNVEKLLVIGRADRQVNINSLNNVNVIFIDFDLASKGQNHNAVVIVHYHGWERLPHSVCRVSCLNDIYLTKE
ncbi:hypothetical protein PHYBLDRAFT_152431 [Phycomyces blakesleeanus NRRL 1555(-)]|uniref:Uncharacterized protein n=1 Tax=Phycomyces blakesleeanus (strain ATCC 8743b / DSM 1359 / FGSC 10004 / NBRC 33097 / NRRL 1555) TaxID=763407 RepID=A0A167JNG9_PHYB8|nr:hypothetical protein PHYBLDRAFT_152431 [Phycomyces blakesleeanus NRRL 1555(-)]OAD66359.1 hypothetical protein PHYBLDRAFT_152431 [Phycomyces blakesleeanus NRRL 1555(-)]|eukprot:XP_018284399.1 hypothetical protein PHYBLDRAFT_152431 [Phycomyces blakesleeanus NRRL 1555(-)]